MHEQVMHSSKEAAENKKGRLYWANLINFEKLMVKEKDLELLQKPIKEQNN